MRASQRNIMFEEIIDCVSSPDKITNDDNNISCYKKIWWEYLILVYAKNSEDDLVIITVLKTSQIRKYYNN